MDIRVPPHGIDSPLPAGTTDTLIDVIVVEVRHNLVTGMRKDRVSRDVPLPDSRLEIATELAENYRRNRCIDGLYRFATVERARVFAILCLEFVEALINKRLDRLRKLRPGESFEPD